MSALDWLPLPILGLDIVAATLGIVTVDLQLSASYCHEAAVYGQKLVVFRGGVVIILSISQSLLLGYITRTDSESIPSITKAWFASSWTALLVATGLLLMEEYMGGISATTCTLFVGFEVICCVFHFISCYCCIRHEAMEDDLLNYKCGRP
ncbi:hypothetical protein DM860_018236 [Cuscuta australis]|uniref:Uncharacterized protein n=1 Tax=Cuscuta australis TaxID=267555 RepID=A0A328DXC3_9ASTE|nr:hypothetical protein DM860_018236 [Cuscuta australis]